LIYTKFAAGTTTKKLRHGKEKLGNKDPHLPLPPFKWETYPTWVIPSTIHCKECYVKESGGIGGSCPKSEGKTEKTKTKGLQEEWRN
jgi:hypothetical protein